MILVAGATGLLGGTIARRLLAAGRQTRVLVRATSNYQPLVEAGAEPAIGDLRDRASLDVACQGIEAVITTAIPRPMADAETAIAINLVGNRNLIDAAQAAGVGHFVFTAGFGADPNSPVPFIAAKGKTEVYLRSCGMRYTILEPDMLADTSILFMVGQAALSGQPVWVAGDGSDRHAFVTNQDVAACAVAALACPAAWNRTLTIGGLEALTLAEVAACFERALGRPVEVRHFLPAQPPAGVSPYLVPMLASNHLYPPVPNALETAAELGVTLTPMEAFVRSVVAHMAARS